MGIRVSVSKVKIDRVAKITDKKVAKIKNVQNTRYAEVFGGSLYAEEEETRIYQGIRDTFSKYKRPDRYYSDIKAIMRDYDIHICTVEARILGLYDHQILSAVTGNEMGIYFIKQYNKMFDLDYSFGDNNERFHSVKLAHTGLDNGVSYLLFTVRMTIAIMAVLLEWSKQHEGVHIEKVLQSLLLKANLTNMEPSGSFIEKVVDIAMDIVIGEYVKLKLHDILTDTGRSMWSTNYALKELQGNYDLPGEILEVYCNKNILPKLRAEVDKQYFGVFEKETDKMQRAKQLSKIFREFSSKKKGKLSAEIVLDSMYINAMLKEAEFSDEDKGNIKNKAGVVHVAEEDGNTIEECDVARVKSSLSTFIELLSDKDVKKALEATDKARKKAHSKENATCIDRLVKGLFNVKIFSKFCKPWKFIIGRCRDYFDNIKESLFMLGMAVVWLVSIAAVLSLATLMINGKVLVDNIGTSEFSTASAIEKGELAMEAVTDLSWFFGAALIGILALKMTIITCYMLAAIIILKRDNVKLKRDPKLVTAIRDIPENKRSLYQHRILLLSELKSEIALREQAKLLLSRRTKSEFIIKYLSEFCNVSDSDAQLYSDELLRARNRKEYKREALLLALAGVVLVSNQSTEKQFSLEELFKRHEITLSKIDEGEKII